MLDDGWVVGAYYAYGGNMDIYFQINGISVACSGNATNYGWFGQLQAKVSKGDKVKFSRTGYSASGIYFIPHK